jgi:hypothetical protein
METTYVRRLLDSQQSDGGWSYNANSSWTEPTCYSILAIRTAGAPDQPVERACEWLARRQRGDGGWAPGPLVEKSTHVTSLAVLALSEMSGYEDIVDRGVDWLLAKSVGETSWLTRLARFAAGNTSGVTEHAGWPWFPGASAWVIPTSLAICALSRQTRAAARVKEARQFLLDRRCPDHGWNHGGLYRPGETPVSYPETTGVALLALSGTKTNIELSLRCGEQHAVNPKSSEGESWLRLGLRAHGHDIPPPSTTHRDWTVNQIALRILTQTLEAGRNPFLNHA